MNKEWRLTEENILRLHEEYFGKGSGGSEIDDTDLCFKVADAQLAKVQSHLASLTPEKVREEIWLVCADLRTGEYGETEATQKIISLIQPLILKAKGEKCSEEIKCPATGGAFHVFERIDLGTRRCVGCGLVQLRVTSGYEWQSLKEGKE